MLWYAQFMICDYLSGVRTLCAIQPFLFFFNDTATTEIYTLSLHDALPIFPRPTYMDLPVGLKYKDSNGQIIDPNTHCLHVKKNLYGGKDSGRTWFQHLRQRLITPIADGGLGFEQSEHDECVFYRRTTVLLVYTDEIGRASCRERV